jgi:deoxycytidine triphosphate deaminase
MLSNVDLRKKLKTKSIAIDPFKSENIEGSSVYVTASKSAWSIKTKESISDGTGKIIVPANDTGIIVSAEWLYVDYSVAGVCLSRVRMVSQGVRHVGAPVKTGHTGPLVISIQNPRDEPFELKVGDEIAVVVFHELDTEATIGFRERDSTVFSVLADTVNMSQDEKKSLVTDPRTKDEIKTSMGKDKAYTDYLSEEEVTRMWKYVGSFLKQGLIYILPILSTVVAVLISRYLGN